VSRLANAVINVRAVWKWAHENRHLSEKMQFGSGFSRPSAKIARAAKNAHGARMFEPSEILRILDIADVNFRAMLLLAINMALGPTDLAYLPTSAVNLESGWLDFPRRKTAVPRRVPLWPETLESIQEVLDARPEPKRGNDALLFLDGDGKGYAGKRGNDAIGRLFRLAAEAAGVESRCLYDARRSFLTIGERARDPVAVSAIMGHVAGQRDMSAIYRQRIDDERLVAVTEAVRVWLYGTEGQYPTDSGDGTEGQEQADTDSGDEPLTIAIHKARKAINETSGPIQDTLRDVWLPEITAAIQGDVEAARRVLATWGESDARQFRVVRA
jgi:integrase